MKKKSDSKTSVSLKQQLVMELRNYLEKHGRYPKARDLGRNNGTHGYAAYQKVFGTLKKALNAAGVTQVVNYQKSKSELLKELRSYSKALGRIPKATDMRNKNGVSSYDSYASKFGSWENALLAAGLKPDFSKSLSRKELLDALQNYHKKFDYLPTQNTYLSNSEFPSPTQYRREFGTFGKAIDVYLHSLPLDTIVQKKSASSSKKARLVYRKEFVTKANLISILKKCFHEHGEVILSARNAEKYGLPRITLFYKIFGSWSQALIEAGLPLSKKASYSRNELLEIISSLSITLKRTPVASDLGRPYPSYPTFVDEFGSWEKALSAAGLKMSEGIYGKKSRLWERKCEEISLILYPDAILQKTFNGIGRPDIYVPSKNLIIDAKHSSYFVPGKSDAQIKSYLKVAKTIQLWCIFKTVEKSIPNVEYIYAPQLQIELKQKGYLQLAKEVGRFLDTSDFSSVYFGTITKREVIQMLQIWAEKSGHTPSIRELSASPNLISSSTIRKLFGSYNEAIKAAGLSPNVSGIKLKQSKKQIIDKIHIYWKKYGIKPTARKLRVPMSSIRREFGHFANALREAGLRPNKNHMTKSDLVRSLRELVQDRDTDPRNLVSQSHDLPGWATIVRKIGSVAAVGRLQLS